MDRNFDASLPSRNNVGVDLFNECQYDYAKNCLHSSLECMQRFMNICAMIPRQDQYYHYQYNTMPMQTQQQHNQQQQRDGDDRCSMQCEDMNESKCTTNQNQVKDNTCDSPLSQSNATHSQDQNSNCCDNDTDVGRSSISSNIFRCPIIILFHDDS